METNESLTALSAVDQARAVRAGELTAEALVHAHLARIARLDGGLGAFLRVDRDGALAAAKAVDDKRKGGEPLGPMAGVTVALKDQIVTLGLETTAGSPPLGVATHS